jgi:integrase
MPRLTKKLVDSIERGKATIHVWDDQLAGFGLRVSLAGKRSYVAKYRVGGGRGARQRWYQIGVHGQITCEQARQLAQQVLAAVARGEDPQQVRLEKRIAPTVAELWEKYQAEHLPRKKPGSVLEDVALANSYLLPQLGKLKVQDVSRQDIAKVHQQLSDKPYRANRLLALISKMFNLAELWGYRPDHSNPTRHVAKFPEKARQRFLSVDEVTRLATALNEAVAEVDITTDMAAAIRLLLLTGARRSEILNAEWDWIDWDSKIIRLPDSKTGAKPIYLSEQAVTVLQQQTATQAKEPGRYVIRGRQKDAPLVNLRKAWVRVCQRAGIADVRIHDLRHTAASIGVASGLTLPLIGRLLGHTQAQTTQRYAHVDSDPALAAANAIGHALASLVEAPSGQGDEPVADFPHDA